MKTIEQINFAPLKAPPIGDNGLLQAITVNKANLKVLIGTAAVVLLVSLKNGAYFLVGVAIIGTELISMYLGEYKKARTRAWQEFARANGLVLTSSVGSVPYAMLGVGDSIESSDVAQGEFSGNVWNMFEYSYTISNGKNSWEYTSTIIHVKLDKMLPYIALDNKKNAYSFPQLPGGVKQIHLEGDFNNHFEMFTQPGSHVDVLSIITPDIMQVLIDDTQLLDVEIIDDNAYFIATGDKRDEIQLKLLMQSVDRIMAELNQRIKSLQYDDTQMVGTNGKISAAITQANAEYMPHINKLQKVLTIVTVCGMVLMVLAVLSIIAAVTITIIHEHDGSQMIYYK